ncbi:MAG: BREX system ATP-binding protein BrxD [Myxococcales bacterium]|nr:BREX system ATP-binding protein BrxD [Myxococcales bacterium]MBK7192717.1 BREX system ATP-binding protein BrxD [Myxococcales bacterium]MBP6846096.1 BREX system ATP-binding protein BrxD [Kofleriaceae bacterium]
MLTQNDAKHIFNQLRAGLVPERGLDALAVGVEKPRDELARQLDLVKDGSGSIKFLRGGYGCGKTFMARLAIADAQARGFVTSFVVVSDNDLRFHRFDEVYRKVVTELATATCPRGALGDILDRWIGRIEDGLVATGVDADAPGFDARVRAKLQEELATLTGGKAPADFVRVIQTIFDLKQAGELADAAALISWLSGSGNIGAAVKRRAEIKGDIGSSDALAYLRGILEIAKSAGYQGLLIVIDEAETILRMRTDSRHKSLNGIRQISDAAAEYPGLLWLFTGTPTFFDDRRGVAGLAPLHDRIRFLTQGGFTSLRQPQLELKPFDAARLRNAARRLRELYPMPNRERVMTRVSDAFIDRLVAKVTEGFRGDVGVVPRQFLRELVNVMDLVDVEEEFDPEQAYGFTSEPLVALSPEEQAARDGRSAAVAAVAVEGDDDDGPIPEVQVW